MKGIMFNIAEQFIIDHYGEDALEEVIASCNLKTKEPFVGPGTYPDEDMTEIVVKSSEKLGITPAELLKTLGRYAFAKLAERHPVFLTGHTSSKEFLKTVDKVIHVEVRKLYQHTILPTFSYSEPSDDELIIVYYSERKLYALMEGLIDGVADYFKQSITQKHRIMEKEGVEVCEFHLCFN
jgi:hypothetical protein